MISLIKRMFNKVPMKNENVNNMDMICNSARGDLNSFCSLEYSYMTRTSN